MNGYGTFDSLRSLIMPSWGRETCARPFDTIWTPDYPSLGQKDVTALVTHDLCDGTIRAHQGGAPNPYFFNRLPDGRCYDLTHAAPGVVTLPGHDVDRSRVFEPEDGHERAQNRYRLLRMRVLRRLNAAISA